MLLAVLLPLLLRLLRRREAQSALGGFCLHAYGRWAFRLGIYCHTKRFRGQAVAMTNFWIFDRHQAVHNNS